MSDEATLFETYRDRWAALYHVPCSLLLSVLDFGKLGTHRQVLSDEQLEQALEGFFETDDPYVLQRRHPLGLFLVNPMRWAPVLKPAKSGSFCAHVPVCQSFSQCTKLVLAEGRLGRV